MPSQDQQNADKNSKKSDSKIRTMKSDIAEYLKEAKPSLIQILTKQIDIKPEPIDSEGPALPWKIIVIALGGIALFGVFIWFGYQYFLVPAGPVEKAPVIVEQKIPASPIAVEKTDTITVSPNLLNLQQGLFNSAQNIERSGSFKRLIIVVRDGAKTRTLAPVELFGILDADPPSQINDSLIDSAFFYVYYSSAGPRIVMIAPSRSIERTFAGMLGWENSIQRDLEILFLGEKITPVIAPFVDRTFKNIDYRYLKIGPELGVGYFIFSAKNYLVLSTSEEAMQLVINRLFEAR